MITRRRRSKRIWYVLLGVFVAVFLFSFLAQKFNKIDESAEAASLANFDPGNIISDYQMSNYKSMTESQIQSFLKSKNSCNDRDLNKYLSGKKISTYSETYPPYTWHVKDNHFVCMADEKIESETAARIIYQTAQDYRINPQVLIVLLQKEQGLVTDTFPNSFQYRSATGYGCPDTAACSSKYYGFKNQLRNAAAMFRTVLDGGWTNYPVGKNYIQYSPNAACGGSIVNIKNRATSALYRYTPYQPNKAALAAGYGTANCGAYGNRNFYLYFQDWFGGINANSIVFEKMVTPRIMKVDTRTLVVNGRELRTTNTWLERGQNFYFTKKTTVFWGNEQQTCLQRKIDEGTNNCVLMARLDDFSIEKDITNYSDGKEYEITQFTCRVNILNQEAECNNKQYSKGDILVISGEVTVDGKNLLIEEENNRYAVLATKSRRKLNYKQIGPVLMRLTADSSKYEYNEKLGKRVQDLTVKTNGLIKVMDSVEIDKKIYYRTLHDHNNYNYYLIPSSVFSNEIFSSFIRPRNLKIKMDSFSTNLDNGNNCTSYKKGSIQKYTKKIDYDGETYFQSVDEKGQHCAMRASNLIEVE